MEGGEASAFWNRVTSQNPGEIFSVNRKRPGHGEAVDERKVTGVKNLSSG